MNPTKPTEYVLVPREPTDEQAAAAFIYDIGAPTARQIENAKTDYRLMIAAAPQAAQAAGDGEHVATLLALRDCLAGDEREERKQGEIDTRDAMVAGVMAALHGIDGGRYSAAPDDMGPG